MDVRHACRLWVTCFVICVLNARNHGDRPGITISQITAEMDDENANSNENHDSGQTDNVYGRQAMTGKELFNRWSDRLAFDSPPLYTVSELLHENHPGVENFVDAPQRHRYADLSTIPSDEYDRGTPDDVVLHDQRLNEDASTREETNRTFSSASVNDSASLGDPMRHVYNSHEIFVSPAKKIAYIRYHIERKGPNTPVAVIVDTARTSFENIKLLWAFLTNGSEMNASIVLFAYNDTNRTTVSLVDNIPDALDGLEPSDEVSPGLPGGPVYRTVSQALTMINPESSVFLFTGRRAGDEAALSKTAVAEMAEKGCEFHVIWCGECPKREDDIARYEQIARRLRGDFIEFTNSDTERTLEAILHRGEKIVDRTGLVGYTETEFELDDAFAGFHITVVGNLTRAVLEAPTGDTIEMPGLLLSVPSDLIGLTSSPVTTEVRLDARNSPAGRWLLKVLGDERSRYHLKIVALTQQEVADDRVNPYEKITSPENLTANDSDNAFTSKNTTMVPVDKIFKMPHVSYDDLMIPNDDDANVLYDLEHYDDIIQAEQRNSSKMFKITDSEETKPDKDDYNEDKETNMTISGSLAVPSGSQNSTRPIIHQAKKNLKAVMTKIVVPEYSATTMDTTTTSTVATTTASVADLALIYFGHNDSVNANARTTNDSENISQNHLDNYEVIMNMAHTNAEHSPKPINVNAATDLVQLYFGLRRPGIDATGVDNETDTETLEDIVVNNGSSNDTDLAKIVVASEKEVETGQRKEALELEDLGKITIADAALFRTVIVELSSNTNLVVRPGTLARLIFEVTNNHALTIRHYFQARSVTFNVANLQPRDLWIDSGQTASVVVDVVIPSGVSDSTVDTVTLHVQAIESVDKSTYLYVQSLSSTITDTTSPTISYNFNNNCAGKLASGTCSSNQWSTGITIQDSGSGLQRVTSSPKGIQATTEFISGTKSAVSFYYSSTCCQTTVQITATDSLGNYGSRTIDVTTWDNLTQGEIAAITLGTLFILILIVIIIIGIVCCIRRRKSLDLTYTQRYGSRPPAARAERTSF